MNFKDFIEQASRAALAEGALKQLSDSCLSFCVHKRAVESLLLSMGSTQEEVDKVIEKVVESSAKLVNDYYENNGNLYMTARKQFDDMGMDVTDEQLFAWVDARIAQAEKEDSDEIV